jgi:3-methyladenine DNA glycosylase AlkD
MTALATAVLRRLDEAYAVATDPVRAASQRAYMRNQFEYVGLGMPALRVVWKQVLAGLGPPDEADLRAAAVGCWTRAEREYQYFACFWLRRHTRTLTPDALPVLRRLIETKSWWDTVDTLAADSVGPLVLRQAELVSTMDEWVLDGNLWVVRTAILHQLTYKAATDAGRLFRYCLLQAGHKDFFIRKAIGWALRQYARTDPDAVTQFLRASGDQLSALSVREAAKHLTL